MKITQKEMERLSNHAGMFIELPIIFDKYSIRTQGITAGNSCFMSFYQEVETGCEEETKYSLNSTDLKRINKTLKTAKPKDDPIEIIDNGVLLFKKGNKSLSIPVYDEEQLFPDIDNLDLDYSVYKINRSELENVDILPGEMYINIYTDNNNVTFESKKQNRKVTNTLLSEDTQNPNNVSGSFQYEPFINIIKAFKEGERLVLFLKEDQPLSIASEDGKIRYWLAGANR